MGNYIAWKLHSGMFMKSDELLCCWVIVALFIWPWPCTQHKRWLLPTSELTNTNVLVNFNSVSVQNRRFHGRCTYLVS